MLMPSRWEAIAQGLTPCIEQHFDEEAVVAIARRLGFIPGGVSDDRPYYELGPDSDLWDASPAGSSRAMASAWSDGLTAASLAVTSSVRLGEISVSRSIDRQSGRVG